MGNPKKPQEFSCEDKEACFRTPALESQAYSPEPEDPVIAKLPLLLDKLAVVLERATSLVDAAGAAAEKATALMHEAGKNPDVLGVVRDAIAESKKTVADKAGSLRRMVESSDRARLIEPDTLSGILGRLDQLERQGSEYRPEPGE